MANILDDVQQAAADIQAQRDVIVADTAVLEALIKGPASGVSSEVDTGGAAGIIKTLARVLAEAAGRVGLQYQFGGSGDTTADPGAGQIKADNADWDMVSEIAISSTDINGQDHAGFLAGIAGSTTLLNRGLILLQKIDGSATVALRIVGAVIAGAGFYRVPVAKRSAAGTLSAADPLGALFVPTGDKGGNNYTISGWFPGDALPAGGEQLVRHYFETDVTFPANLPGSILASRTAADEDAIYPIKKFANNDDLVGTVVGTLTIATGGKVAAKAAAEWTQEAGTFLAVCAPDPPVTGIADLTVLITGNQVTP